VPVTSVDNGCARRWGRDLWSLVAAATAAPVLWALSDLLVAGEPLWSLTRTQDAVDDAGLPC